jgi:PRC-barrel domain
MRAKHPFALIVIVFAAFAAGPSWAADDTAVPQAGTNTPQPNTAPAAATKEGVPPPSVTIIGAADAHGVLGRDVRSPADENMGRIVDVIVDRAGLVRAAVIDFGGFLGVGSRKIVVDWNALRFWRIGNKSDSITLELTKDQVTAAPEYKEDTPIVVLGASGSLQPLQFKP